MSRECTEQRVDGGVVEVIRSVLRDRITDARRGGRSEEGLSTVQEEMHRPSGRERVRRVAENQLETCSRGHHCVLNGAESNDGKKVANVCLKKIDVVVRGNTLQGTS